MAEGNVRKFVWQFHHISLYFAESHLSFELTDKRLYSHDAEIFRIKHL